MGSSKQTTNTNSNTYTDISETQKTHKENFTSPEMKQAYSQYKNNAFNNYNQSANLANKLYNQYMSGQSLGDDSYFKQAWDQAQGIDQSNLKKINSMALNPNDNADWVQAQNDIDANTRRGWGKTLNQVNQNIIASNMANGSGHQSAAYQTAANLNSQLAADRANRWQQQYNQNMQNVMQANGQLENFYTTLSNIGLDYTKLTQQDLSTLLQAYQQQNNALGSLGQAVEMGSDPTVTTEGRQVGTSRTQSTSTSKSGGGFGSILGGIAGAASSFIKL